MSAQVDFEIILDNQNPVQLGLCPDPDPYTEINRPAVPCLGHGSHQGNNAVFNRFLGRPLESIFVLELCAGTATLTSVVLQAGMQGIGIDSHRNRHVKRGPVAVFDLTNSEHVQIIRNMITDGEVDVVHASPPCGTASRARDIPLSVSKGGRAGQHGPPPLRSESYPEGLPGLADHNLMIVQLANLVYSSISEIIWLAQERGLLWSIENPKRSYMWLTKFFRSLWEKFIHNLFQGCMHGGTRDKWSLWLCNWTGLSVLRAVCDGKHEHAKWGVVSSAQGSSFATAEEAAYPRLLCVRYVQALVKELADRGLVLPPDHFAEGWSDNILRQKAMAVTSLRQPKGRSIPPLVKEFKQIMSLRLDTGVEPPVKLSERLKEAFQQVPENSKLLRLENQGVDGSAAVVSVWGVPWTPTEFHQQAALAKHPFEAQASIPDVLLKTIFQMVCEGPETVSRHRSQKLKYWASVKAELAQQEMELHLNFHPSVEAVLKNKSLLLFHQMLKESGFGDADLFGDIVAGFPVIGVPKSSKQFRKNFRPPQLSEQELLSSASWTKHSILSSIRASDDAEMDDAVWMETLEEVSKSWLVPVTESQLDSRFGIGKWAPARRFGLRQGGTLRAIDDYSLPFANFAFGSFESLDLMGVDEISSLLRFLGRLLTQPWSAVDIRLSTGQRLTGHRHSYWSAKGAKLRLLGRTLDLAKAYRQLASSPKTSRWSVIAVWSPVDHCACLFYQPVLAFGAASAVLAFNRTARALWHIGCSQFSLIWTNFFDDFPTIEFEELSASALLCSEGFLQLLGWEYSVKATKRLPFSPLFIALGVQYDLSNIFSGKVPAGPE